MTHPTWPSRHYRFGSWSLLIICAGLVASTLIGFIRFAQWFDRASIQREEAMVSNGINARTAEIEAMVKPNAVWDDAVKHLDNSFDPQWARDNIGIYFYNVSRFHIAGVLDADDRPVYAMVGGADVSADLLQPLVDMAAYAVKQVRAIESGRLSHTAKPTSAGANLRDPIHSTVPRVIDGKIYFVTATLVQPDIGSVRITKPAAPIIITALEANEAFLREFANRYLLADAHFEIGSHDDLTEAHALLTDETGTEVAMLDWIPARPGSEVLSKLAPWLALIVGTVGIFGVAQYRRSVETEESLFKSELNASHLAAHDPLTGLFNRADFECRLAALWAANASSMSRSVVLCIDLDHFTEINDRFGHAVGDDLLKQVALRLIQTTGDRAICARFGGDGFAILIPDCELPTGVQVAQEILQTFEVPFRLVVGEKFISCSIGVAASDLHSDGALEVLRQADLALHQAKLDGRGRVSCYDQRLDAKFQLRAQLTELLRTDLLNGRLDVVYQPQVNAGGIIGAEALIRWTRADHGTIAPSMFVPLAEQAGLMRELGDFVLSKVLEDRKQWPDLKIAINVSGSQLRDPEFGERLLDTLTVSATDFDRIELEITEGVLLAQDGLAELSLAMLRQAGVKIALDDFGTGYSSLSYLKRLPIDKIKIDRSFIAELGEPKANALVRAIINLAAALDLSVLAEGVETPEQQAILARQGCHQVQGYLTGRPMTAAALKSVIERGDQGVQIAGQLVSA